MIIFMRFLKMWKLFDKEHKLDLVIQECLPDDTIHIICD
jgi:hypothetical protein